MYISDLHIHSRFSRATSRDLTPSSLELWARKKGIHILGTGDFTHPAWRAELKEQLEEAEPGLYLLKKDFRTEDGPPPPPLSRALSSPGKSAPSTKRMAVCAKCTA